MVNQLYHWMLPVRCVSQPSSPFLKWINNVKHSFCMKWDKTPSIPGPVACFLIWGWTSLHKKTLQALWSRLGTKVLKKKKITTSNKYDFIAHKVHHFFKIKSQNLLASCSPLGDIVFAIYFLASRSVFFLKSMVLSEPPPSHKSNYNITFILSSFNTELSNWFLFAPG